MNLPITAVILRSAHEPGSPDGLNLPMDDWADPVPVSIHGWYPPSPNDVNLGVGRRAELCTRILILPAGSTCANLDHWTFPDGEFEQMGAAVDYGHGPFSTQTPLLAYLKQVQG